MLVQLDKDYAEQAPTDSWPDYYAARLMAHFA
jgi:hypothetical protein